MLKKAAIKAVVATTIAAGAFIVPSVVAGGTQLTLSAGPDCEYQAPATTTTVLNGPAAVQGGTASGGAATVDGPGTLPSGQLSVTAYPYSGSGYAASGTVVGSGTASGTSPDVSYSTQALPGNNTYKLIATYTTPECSYQNSTSDPLYVSVYKYDTVLSLSGAGRTYTATVTAPNRDASQSTVATPTGTARFISRNNGGNVVNTDVPLTSAQATYTLGNNSTFISAQYLGNDFYNQSNVDTTR